MADIKTRDVVKGTIKKIDKAAIAADRMRSAYVQTKEKAEHTTHPDEHNAEEYASDRVEGGVDRITHEAAHQFDKQGRKGLEETKRNVSKAKDGVQRFREKRAAESMKRQTVRTSGNKTIKAVEQTEKTIKQSAGSAGKKTIKTAGKGTAKAAQRSVKTTKTAIKTTQQAAKAAQKTAQATVKASQKAAQVAKAAAKATVAGVKAAVKATIAAVKAIIAATKALVAAIAAGGWVAVAVIVVICLIALICGSVFGIFFSGEDSGTGMSMQTAVQEINADYDAKMEAEKNSVAYDNMEISGGRAVWKDVLAVYAVKTNTDKDNPQEVATMDESKKQILSDIFWEMNSISSRSESHSETEITETDDGNGNIVQTETTVTKTTLYITVSHLTVDEMADLYGFNEEQREYLAGRIVQLQNLPQNHIPDLAEARSLVKCGDYEALELLYENVPEVLSELIRTAFVPKPGCKFIVSDFSAIEARVLSWLAGEKWRMDTFAEGGDIYCATAERMFHCKVVKHGENGELRQKGKQCELSCGYGGSVGALKAMGALEAGMQEDELKPLVDA